MPCSTHHTIQQYVISLATSRSALRNRHDDVARLTFGSKHNRTEQNGRIALTMRRIDLTLGAPTCMTLTNAYDMRLN